MGDVEDYVFTVKKKPYPSLKKLARKRDGWEEKRKGKKN
jgi:hypothetical protein